MLYKVPGTSIFPSPKLFLCTFKPYKPCAAHFPAGLGSAAHDLWLCSSPSSYFAARNQEILRRKFHSINFGGAIETFNPLSVPSSLGSPLHGVRVFSCAVAARSLYYTVNEIGGKNSGVDARWRKQQS